MEAESQNYVQVFDINDTYKKDCIYKVARIFTKPGAQLYEKKRLCELQIEKTLSDGHDALETLIIKAQYSGIVHRLYIKKDDTLLPGQSIVEIKACLHPTMLGNICCDCGEIIEDEDKDEAPISRQQTSISMLHSIPDLKVSKKEAEKLGAEDISNLLEQKKLALLVDLDQTLIHTTNDNIPPNLKDVYHFQLVKNGPWYHTRLRPFAKRFLQNISQYYELHICTFGIREYAHYIAHFLDPEKKLFGHRILSRNECLDPFSKKGNLLSLFPCGDNMVCIIDDRSDVWNYAPNVIQVLPYHFFKHTGDINAPPGLQKKENDEKNGYDFSKLDLKSDKKSEKEKSTEDSSKEENSTEERSDNEDINDEKVDKKEESKAETDKENVSKTESDRETDKENTLKTETNSESSSNAENKPTSNNAEDNTVESESTNDSKSTESNKDSKSTETNKDSESSELNINSESAETNELDVPDPDDYLLYLEDILMTLHKEFYNVYNPDNFKKNSSMLPDLKTLVPDLKMKVLANVNIVFSGVVPTHQSLKSSKAYLIATHLGANVTEKLVLKPKDSNGDEGNYTTHLVAANLHTEKVHRAKKSKHVQIVSPNWLWCCAERWEHIDERLYVLTPEIEKDVKRVPPFHCFSNHKRVFPDEGDCDFNSDAEDEQSPGPSEERKRTSSESLYQDINPMAFLSNDDTKRMEEEVDEILSADDDDETEDVKENNDSSDSEINTNIDEDSRCSYMKRSLTEDENEDDDDEDDKSKSKKRKFKELGVDLTDSEGEDELPSVKFREGGGLPSDDSDGEELSDDEEMGQFGDILARELMD